MHSIHCLFSCANFYVQLILLSNTSDFIFKSLSKYDYSHVNCNFPYTGSHLGRHLEFLKLLNGDKMSPAGFLMKKTSALQICKNIFYVLQIQVH